MGPITRIRRLLLTPRTEWRAIAAEDAGIARLYVRHILPLAGVPVVGAFARLVYRATLRGRFDIAAWGLVNALVSYAAALAVPLMAAAVLAAMGSRFRSSGRLTDALRLIAYAATPFWLAGIFYLVPGLALLAIPAGLYAVYLFYLGAPAVMRTPQDHVVPFMVVAALSILVASALTNFVGTNLVRPR